MEPTEITSPVPPPSPDFALFTRRAITVAAGLGGPLAGTYLMAKNFRSLGREDASRKTLTIGAMLTLVFFTAIAFMPSSVMDKVPSSVLPVVEGLTFYFIIDLYQQNDIEAHLRAGGKKGSWRVILGSVLLSLIISLVYFAIVLIMFMPQ